MKRLFLVMTLIVSCAYAQTGKISSRFYFPGLIGTDFQSNRASATYKKGLLLNTAAEYRPDDTLAFFYRFNFDGITNKYNTNAVDLPTNVKGGSQHHTYLLIGPGYRKKYRNISWYAAFQPGVSIRNYDEVVKDGSSYVVSSFNKNNLSVKITGGFEYYLAPHFALIMEAARYQNSFPNHPVSFNNSEMAISFGFTTTLF